MPQPFWPATAEQVIAVVDAVVANGGSADVDLVSRFSVLPKDSATSALNLAVDLGLLTTDGNVYESASPISRFISTPLQMQKAAALRIVLEAYEPFATFRERMTVVSAVDAADQTKALLDLDSHREKVKDTLLSLGTFSQALVTEGGGQYVAGSMAGNQLELLATACSDQVAAEALVRHQLGQDAAGVVDRVQVILPLADAILQSKGNPRGAVVTAGNAVESFLVGRSATAGVNLAGATGINSKVQKYLDAKVIPTKIGAVGKYLGHVRNAADHGIDSDVGYAWTILPDTGIQYPFVACSFIRATVDRLSGKPPVI